MAEEKKKSEVEKDIKIVEVAKDSLEKSDGAPKKRRIVIETDGNSINLVSAEVSGRIELVAILQNLIAFLNQTPK